MPQVIDDLVAAVASADNVFDGAVTFIHGVPGMIQAAVDKALANGATAEQLAPLTAVADDITAKAAELQAAMLAGTSTPTAPEARKAK